MNAKMRKRLKNHKAWVRAAEGLDALSGFFLCGVGGFVIFTAENGATMLLGGLIIVIVGLPIIIHAQTQKRGNPPTARRALMGELDAKINPICPDCHGWGDITPPFLLRLWLRDKPCETCAGMGFLNKIDGDLFLKIGHLRFTKYGAS